MLRQIASGMCFLHEREPPIIHRDLNTNNILVYSVTAGQVNIKVRACFLGLC